MPPILKPAKLQPVAILARPSTTPVSVDPINPKTGLTPVNALSVAYNPLAALSDPDTKSVKLCATFLAPATRSFTICSSIVWRSFSAAVDFSVCSNASFSSFIALATCSACFRFMPKSFSISFISFSCAT
jgi:hypothetical protein